MYIFLSVEFWNLLAFAKNIEWKQDVSLISKGLLTYVEILLLFCKFCQIAGSHVLGNRCHDPLLLALIPTTFPYTSAADHCRKQDSYTDAHLCTSIIVPILIFKSLPIFNWSFQLYLLTQASIMSVAMSLSLCSKWWANSGSGQWRSKTNICRASSFQKRSSDVAEPFL